MTKPTWKERLLNVSDFIAEHSLRWHAAFVLLDDPMSDEPIPAEEHRFIPERFVRQFQRRCWKAILEIEEANLKGNLRSELGILNGFVGNNCAGPLKRELVHVPNEPDYYITLFTTATERISDSAGTQAGAAERGGLKVCELRAYQAYELATSKSESALTDHQAFEWVKENAEDYEPPAFETWARYVRAARRYYGDQKNSPRTGRTGRSVVDRDEV